MFKESEVLTSPDDEAKESKPVAKGKREIRSDTEALLEASRDFARDYARYKNDEDLKFLVKRLGGFTKEDLSALLESLSGEDDEEAHKVVEDQIKKHEFPWI